MSDRIIQSMLLPETEEENHGLYYRKTDKVKLCGRPGAFCVPDGESVRFFTYFNGFYMKQWRRWADLGRLYMRVEASGSYELRFCHASADRPEEAVCDRSVQVRESGRECTVYEAEAWNREAQDVCWLEFHGLEGGGELFDFAFGAEVPAPQEVRLAVVICTYRREADVRRNIGKLEGMPADSRPAVFLIDNGNTLGGERFPDFVRYVANRNCGGTGGFTRGMLEVLEDAAGGFTHVVLMDDDIVLETGTLLRTRSVLSCLRKECRNAVLAGSLLRRGVPWQQYECGAVWNRGEMTALKHDLDLRSPADLLKNTEIEPVDYGGWWYCCFPLSGIREKGLPLPFFVHKDDIEYGLRMGTVMTLNGIGVWHEAFEQKLLQTAEYYDIRNMAIVNALCLRDWNKEEWKTYLRKWTVGNILRGRYEYVRLNMRGAADFLKGAGWLERTDAAALHRKIGSLLSPLIPAGEITERESSRFYHAVPGVSVYTAARKRRILYEDSSGMCLRVQKSVTRSMQCMGLLRKLEKKIDSEFDAAVESYRKGYMRLTKESFWRRYLDMEGKE